MIIVHSLVLGMVEELRRNEHSIFNFITIAGKIYCMTLVFDSPFPLTNKGAWKKIHGIPIYAAYTFPPAFESPIKDLVHSSSAQALNLWFHIPL